MKTEEEADKEIKNHLDDLREFMKDWEGRPFTFGQIIMFWYIMRKRTHGIKIFYGGEEINSKMLDSMVIQ